MIQLSLSGKWTVREPSTGLELEGWVPGSVFTDLLRNSKISDPFYRDNELQSREISSKIYEYERAFVVDEEMIHCDPVLLHCEGLDTLADIYVNGKFVGHTENMHRRYDFNLKSALHLGQNQISIVFSPTLPFLAEAHQRSPIWGQSDTVEGFTHLRKAHYMFGWDWGPTIPDAGIYRPLSIFAYNGSYLTDVEVTQRHEGTKVFLQIRIQLQCRTDDAFRVDLGMSHSDGTEQHHSVDVSGIAEPSNRFETEVEIEQPQLWWPNGLGEQPLYSITVSVLAGTVELDRWSRRIGLRTLTVRRQNDAWGESFEFVANGVSIFAQGANYIPEDSLPGRFQRDRTRRLLEDCVEANFNLIRVWGGGIYPDEYFYNLCDELGLIVWQDFMYACGTYELTPSFEVNVIAEAEDVVRRLRHHAALGMLCGNNEMEEAWVHWEFDKPEWLREQYLRLFEHLLPDVCARLAPQTFYWQASPSSGGQFDNPTDENRGDVHYWDVWHGLKPFSEYRKFYFRFCSEFGFQSFPSMKTIESFTLPADRNPFSYVMEQHQKNKSANGKILFYLSDNFQYPTNLKALVYTSQVLQAEAIKYGVEHWRRNRGRCMGSIYWQLNDCWPVASWSSIDYFGRWKALHYFAKKFYQPVLLSAAESEMGASLYVTNDTQQEFSGTVRWSLRSADDTVIESGEVPFTADPLHAMEVISLDFSSRISAVTCRRKHYLSYELWSEQGCVYHSTVLFVKAKHFEFKNPHLKVRVTDNGDDFAIEVTARAFAKYVELELVSVDGHFSDNYFDLVGGQSKIVWLSKIRLSQPLTLSELREQICLSTLYDTYALEN